MCKGCSCSLLHHSLCLEWFLSLQKSEKIAQYINTSQQELFVGGGPTSYTCPPVTKKARKISILASVSERQRSNVASSSKHVAKVLAGEKNMTKVFTYSSAATFREEGVG